MKKWLIFIRERFSPLFQIPPILCFFVANVAVALGSFPQLGWQALLGFLIVLCAFFRFRVFDEIKDFETDRELHSERPLARGLLSVTQAKCMGLFLASFELVLSLFLGGPAALAALCYIFYSFLMYKEFFLSSWLRPKLATYAITHTLVVSWLSLFIFSAVTGLPFWKCPASFALFVLANWLVFNIFEFGRKTFGIEEEKPLIDSYSKRFGSRGAALFVLAFALLALWATPLSLYLALPLALSALLYVHLSSAFSAKLFRLSCSLFILTFYLSVFL